MTIKDIVSGKKYTTKDGIEKTHWVRIGTVFIGDDGRQRIQIDTIPLNWDGSACIFEAKQPQQNATPQQSAIQNFQRVTPQQPLSEQKDLLDDFPY